MGIEGIISWYQKKIGTYDRQLWEKTIEQRILCGLANIRVKKSMQMLNSDNDDSDVPMKSARLKTEFIDVDLVRGSSFTKAKPKHGFVTVARLATLRFLLMPLYSQWWVQQTSGKIYLLLLGLYITLLFNIAVYTTNISKLPDNSTEYVPCTEIMVPIIMMWVLSLIHSQIVSTQSDPNQRVCRTQKRRNFRRRRKPKTALNKASVVNCSRRNDSSDSLKSSTGVLPKCVIFKPVSENDGPVMNHGRSLKTGQSLVDDGFESFNGNGSSPTDTTEEVEAVGSKAPYPTMKNDSLDRSIDSDTSLNGKFRKYATNENIRNSHSCPNIQKTDLNTEGLDSDNSSCKLKRDVNNKISGDKNEYSKILFSKLMTENPARNEKNHLKKRTWKSYQNPSADSTSCDSEGCETMSSPDIKHTREPTFPVLTEATTSATEWMGVTTNTDDCSYSSEPEPSDTENVLFDPAFAPAAILSPSCDRVSCTVWKRHEIKKVELSVFDISCEIIARVEDIAETMDFFYVGMFYAILLALMPALCRFSNAAMDSATSNELQLSVVEISGLVLEKLSGSMIVILDAAFGTTWWERTVMIVALIQRWLLACLFFFLLSVAERTFKQRFLFAKLFSHLTSSRRARKSQLPHFRLNKVRNIKTWLSVRSYLKKRGPQRSVDVIVSSTFVITLLLLSFLSMELLKDSAALQSQYNLEALLWCLGLGFLLLRFMTLGTKINHKYRSNLSILITEQINLYLQIERKPHKKDELNVANSVLKLAADLLKELETPFKISGFCANPHLYTITKVFVLSALSGVLSEMLGFKLKLHKIKIK